MRNALAAGVVVVTALLGPEALAQYQNRGIGLNLGMLSITHDSPVSLAVPVGLHASTYFDSNVEGTVHTTFMLSQVQVPVTTALGFNIQLGARYLFFTDALRPYAGLQVTYMHLFVREVQFQFGGIGPNLGFDYFFNDAWSVGLRGQFNAILQLDRPIGFSVGGALEVTTWY